MKLFSPQVPLSALQTHLIAGATFVFLAIIATYPLSLHLGNGVVSPSDPLLASWDIAWIAHQLTDAPLQLFDANIFHPLSRTLAFDDLFLGETFLVYPILVATGNPILAHNLATLLSFALCGFTMYLYCPTRSGTNWQKINLHFRTAL